MASNNLLRVTQMNALFLDKEIQRSFQQIIQEAYKHLPPGLVSPIDAEINLLLRLGILHYSVLNKGSTFGQQLLNIKYENIPNFKKALYILFNSLDYVKTRCELWNPSHDINNTIFKCYVAIKILDFLNISIFLRNGANPQLIERILGLNQVYELENAPRTFESKYMARELLWNGFIEILVYLVPLVNYHKIKRIVKYYNPLNRKNSYSSVVPSRVMTMHSKCAHCGQNPILPHHMGCAHIFCYVCLKGNQAADPSYECILCEHKNPNTLCDRVKV